MPSVIYVAIGLPGFIRCPIDANPPVTLVKWKKDGLPLRIDKVSQCRMVFRSLERASNTCGISLFKAPRERQGIPFHLFDFSAPPALIWNDHNKTWTYPSLTYASTVPWLEPKGRWEHPCGRGDGGLSGHLHLHALQCPGFHGMVPSCSPGAKGTSTVLSPVHLDASRDRHLCFLLTCFVCFPPPGQDPPKFSVVPGGEYRQEAGRELVIPCEAEGDPFPNITWRKVRLPPHSTPHLHVC